jgi:hypothetical protein
MSAATILVFMALSRPDEAIGSLADALHGYVFQGLTPIFRGPPPVVDVITPIVKREALRGIDLPVPSTAPGVTYIFNFELGVPERTETSIGSVFAEHADTIGAGKLELGFSYLYAKPGEFRRGQFRRSDSPWVALRVS